ncbi:MAG: hypothetical protein PWP03_548 [Candidatus Woesearchaeota archaeon]|nr:hypothetical protein [Candidatus Woesearchaeota archaeon]
MKQKLLNKQIFAIVLVFATILFSIILNLNVSYSLDLTGLSDATQEKMSSMLNKDKINILFFYSRTCPHCEKVIDSKVLDSLNSSYNVINIDVASNNDLFLEFSNLFKSRKDFYYGAVPTLIVLNSDNIKDSIVLQGDTPIIDFLKEDLAKVSFNTQNNQKNNETIIINKTNDTNEKLTFGKLLWLVIITALADSVNPCIMSVLALLISQLMLFKAKKRIKKYSIVYISTIYISYFIIGILLALGLNAVLTKTSNALNNIIGFYVILIVSLIVIFAGIVNVKDFFAYGKGISFSLSKKSKERVIKLIQELSLASIIILGFIITLIEFPCSGIMYAGLISLLISNHISFANIMLILIFYNIIFVLPLILIVYFVLKGSNIDEVDSFRLKYRKWFRLIMGLVLIGLGIYLLKIIF